MKINEETHPNIAELLDHSLHNEIVDKIKDFLKSKCGLSRKEIWDAIDICYDENNIPVTINMDMVETIVAPFSNDFEKFLAK